MKCTGWSSLAAGVLLCAGRLAGFFDGVAFLGGWGGLVVGGLLAIGGLGLLRVQAARKAEEEAAAARRRRQEEERNRSSRGGGRDYTPPSPPAASAKGSIGHDAFNVRTPRPSEWKARVESACDDSRRVASSGSARETA